MSINEKLLAIQSEIKVPKSQYNAFGKYSYRSCEDILEAIKPLAVKHNCVLKIHDEIEFISSRFYVRAIATLTDCETGEKVEAFGWAREEETKKGMDAAQITGSTSSYARKYALNGLFCLDDTKDADATNKHDKEEKPEPEKPKPPKPEPKIEPKPDPKAEWRKAKDSLIATVGRLKYTEEFVRAFREAKFKGTTSINDVTAEQIKQLEEALLKEYEKQEESA